VTGDGADTAPLPPMMPPRRGWGIFGLGFYKDVAPTALEKFNGCDIFASEGDSHRIVQLKN
jgi:hypothetical protein